MSVEEIFNDGIWVLLDAFSPVELTKRVDNRTTDSFGRLTAINSRDIIIRGLIVPFSEEMLKHTPIGFEPETSHIGLFFKTDEIETLNKIIDANNIEYEVIKLRTDWSIGIRSVHTVAEMKWVL